MKQPKSLVYEELVWRGDECGHEEPVQPDNEVGDWEDCVHCNSGTCIAKVVRKDRVP